MEISASAFLPNINLTVIDVLILILCLSATLFYCYSIYSAVVTFGESHIYAPNFSPPITILKPICGLDRDIYENLATFCRQEYSTYQIIFNVRSPQDPGINVVKRIIQDFPRLDIQLIVCNRIIGTNLKVSNLANALSFAKYEILVIADSDIRVGKDYLQRVVRPLHNKNVGVVTCLYRSVAQGWVEKLEAVGTACDFNAGAITSKQLEGMKFALGSTIVIRREVLKAIGGFEAIADYLADDFQLGYLTAQVGYKVMLSDYIVEHVLFANTLIDSIQHQVRWLRGIRVSRPWGYLGIVFTYGNITSLILTMTIKGSVLCWFGLAITWIVRLIMGWIVGVKYLQDSSAKKYFWLVILRDLMSFAIWCYCFFGTTIEWRGLQFKLTKDGKIIPKVKDLTEQLSDT
ncbi:MAG: bacteriohopanetetrol glucosamine biosynthesis glycosyltransferase HpnI [Nostoc sp. NMS7]|uniref:bacteriohopanetetrol glucosamine biosynthesis glycosyltransferase HpnI n=1 Tax=Nostoc sp. NMS7 TaxID=2815391 RepID=UPI0025E931E2|nr:bacteriohopanetetrol glucosamine biosynthesis glycosyltransferase HpnI [Nostoc sp. NMS7]MBN3947550.1 bacteriohopanetetrol glucosamine biosynthesis glycosyltransferase HpnI [Nostoc sp. NMS7]